MVSSRCHSKVAQRNVLAAVVGNTPAVVTETLWALEQQRDIRLDEIRIITTAGPVFLSFAPDGGIEVHQENVASLRGCRRHSPLRNHS